MISSNFSCYIISQSGMHNRKKDVLTSIKSLSFPIQFFDAIMGDELSVEEVNRFVNDIGLLRKGEIGCALSHLAIYDKFLSSSNSLCFILEDDFTFTPAFNELKLQAILDWMDKQHAPSILLLQTPSSFAFHKDSLSDSLHILETRKQYCTHGYIINRHGAEMILQLQRPLHLSIDHFECYHDYLGIHIYTLSEELITVKEEYKSNSVIDTMDIRIYDDKRTQLRRKALKNLWYRLSVRNKLLFIFRRLKFSYMKRIGKDFFRNKN